MILKFRIQQSCEIDVDLDCIAPRTVIQVLYETENTHIVYTSPDDACDGQLLTLDQFKHVIGSM